MSSSSESSCLGYVVPREPNNCKICTEPCHTIEFLLQFNDNELIDYFNKYADEDICCQCWYESEESLECDICGSDIGNDGSCNHCIYSFQVEYNECRDYVEQNCPELLITLENLNKKKE